MYCSDCGKWNPAKARFCAYCGARLLTRDEEEPEQEHAPEWDAESIFDKAKPEPQAEKAPERGTEAKPEKRAEAVRAPREPHVRMVSLAPEKPEKPGKPEKPEAAAEEKQWRKPAEPPQQQAEPQAGSRRARREAAHSWGERQNTPKAVERKPDARIVSSHKATRAEEDQAYSPWAKPTAKDRALRAARNGAPSTIVPRRGGAELPPEPEEDDLFFDGYDEEPQEISYPDPREEDAREEMRRLTRTAKHVRTYIGLGLTAVTLVLLAAWLFIFPSGQMMLARLGLTDSAVAYAGIAQSAYQSGNYPTAAKNYYQALLLDDDNYEYAIRTAESYVQANNKASASTALAMAIQINASDRRAYRMLQQLYPDVQTRPKAVSELLSQGATLTGDASLTN